MVIKGRAGETTRGSLWAEEEEPGQMEGPKNPKDAAELRESVPTPGSAELLRALIIPIFQMRQVRLRKAHPSDRWRRWGWDGTQVYQVTMPTPRPPPHSHHEFQVSMTMTTHHYHTAAVITPTMASTTVTAHPTTLITLTNTRFPVPGTCSSFLSLGSPILRTCEQ